MIFILIIIALSALGFYIYKKFFKKNNIENYWSGTRGSGQFCYTCKNKNLNDCNQCFNCGVCYDQTGKPQCIGGDYVNGPYNKEKCMKWLPRDPFYRMMQNNDNYKLSYGPHQMNRVI
jgi:hypothetical protein